MKSRCIETSHGASSDKDDVDRPGPVSAQNSKVAVHAHKYKEAQNTQPNEGRCVGVRGIGDARGLTWTDRPQEQGRQKNGPSRSAVGDWRLLRIDEASV
ncbi:uncharacterized protein SPSK_10119 [Sporothrix schenckii 1099-18]|uniref:Uncharacterized protein n=1 Tax=Sporothrix schenckii 1099-18 TaxID=1397361 RepID=A0A0F2M8Q1_SPOSC|nr:uncharacterized protein SPSK_10119 [Sporothrix schenckii 1099-18]KJR85205.1 hypothetical protein SPSK_10119 [Sporothrix schenckii 1099-18]